MSSADANATWKAISTLEWKKNRKKPAAAPNVGAILGEAADVVGKHANPASSPYLNRLSEIQIQDEAHIYQQLVKPEEVKPKRPPQRLFIGKGSRSSRGLKISGSRKVRFNEAGEGSPTHKAALVAAAVGGAASKAAAAGTASIPEPASGVGKSVRIARTSSDSSSSPAAPAKAGRRAGGVSFEVPPANSTSGSTPAPQQRQQQPVACVQGDSIRPLAHAGAAAAANGNSSNNNSSSSSASLQPVLGHVPASASPPTTAAGAGSSSGRFSAAALPAAQQRSPSPPPQRSANPQQQPIGSGTAGTAPGVHQHTRNGSTGSEQHSAATGDNAIMARFLQQQPYGLDSPGSSGRGGSSSSNRAHSMDYTAVMAERKGGSGVVTAGARAARRSTDLVDKQLQWLRDSTNSAGSSSSSCSSGSGSAPVMNPQQPGPSSTTPLAAPSHPGQPDVTLNMGYRPIAIPQELFERWSNMGGTTKPAASAPAPAAAAAVGGSGSGSSSALASKAASRRTTGTFEGPAAAGKQGASAGSPFASRPTSGHEAAAAGLGGGPPHAAGRAAAGVVGGAGSMLQDAAGEGRLSAPSRRLSAGGAQEARGPSVPARQRTADSYTMHTLTASIKPTASSSSSSSNKQPVRPQGSGLVHPGSLASAHSLPSSGRASPAVEPSSPKAHTAAGGSGSSSDGTGRVSGSGGRLSGGSSGTSWQPQSRSSLDKHGLHNGPGGSGSSSGCAGGVCGASGSARRSSRATGSTSSSHGDADGDSAGSSISWGLQAGRGGLLGQPTASATAGQHGGGSSSGGLKSSERAVASPPTGSLGVRQGSSSLAGHVKVHLPEIGGQGGRAAQRH